MYSSCKACRRSYEGRIVLQYAIVTVTGVLFTIIFRLLSTVDYMYIYVLSLNECSLF